MNYHDLLLRTDLPRAKATGSISTAVVSTEAGINQKLAEHPRADGICRGSYQVGGPVMLAPKIILVNSPIVLGSGDVLVGAGPQATILKPSSRNNSRDVIKFHSYADHNGHGQGMCHAAGLQNIAIDGNVLCDETVMWLGNTLLQDVTIHSGSFKAPGEHYFVRLDRVVFDTPVGQCVRLDGQGHVLRDTLLHGFISDAMTEPAMLEFHGSAKLCGFCRTEGDFPVPTIFSKDWNGMAGLLSIEHSWQEVYRKGVQMSFENSRLDTDELWFCTADTPYRFVNSVVNLRKRPDMAGVQQQGGIILVNGNPI